MGRYETLTFTTATVGASGGVVTTSQDIKGNYINIVKIKAVPSVSGGSTEVFIYKRSTFLDADEIYSTKAFPANLLDPVKDNAGVITEVNEGHVLPYEDLDKALKLNIKIKNNHTSARTYDFTIKYEIVATGTTDVTGPPRDLRARCVPRGLSILFGVIADTNATSVTEAELRVKKLLSGDTTPTVDLRTVAEGGSFAHNGTTDFIVTGIFANQFGSQYTITFASGGKAFFAWRLRNSVGWSNWTDGNQVPIMVSQFCETQATGTEDTGPPNDWEVCVEEGPTAKTFIVRATRPRTNGRVLLFWLAQIKDGSTGVWRNIDANAGAALTKYDGSAIAHTLLNSGSRLQRASGSGFGTAVVGDLAILDVRGAVFDEDDCQWGVVINIGSNFIDVEGFFRPQVTSDLRMKIIKPLWDWNSEGYFGDEPNAGIYDKDDIIGDKTTQEFVTEPIEVPTGVTAPEARVFFENLYSRSDGEPMITGVLGCGAGFFCGPRTFKNMSDKRYFVPVQHKLVTLTPNYDSAGGMRIRMLQTHATGAPGISVFAGVKARFRMVPGGANQRMVFRVKYNLNSWTDDFVAADLAAFGLAWAKGTSYWNPLGWGGINANFPAHIWAPIADATLNGPGGLDTTTEFAVTTDFSTKITIEHEDSGATFKRYRMTRMEYAFNGGAFALQSQTSSNDSIVAGMPQLYGIELFLGLMAKSLHATLDVTLKEFELVEGCAFLMGA